MHRCHSMHGRMYHVISFLLPVYYRQHAHPVSLIMSMRRDTATAGDRDTLFT